MPCFSEEVELSELRHLVLVDTLIPFKLCEDLYIFPVVLLQCFVFCTDLSMHMWDLKASTPPVTPDLRSGGLRNCTQLESWIAVEMETPTKQIKYSLLFLLSFTCAKSSGIV